MAKVKAPSWVVLSGLERVVWVGRRSLKSMLKIVFATIILFLLGIGFFIFFPLIEPWITEKLSPIIESMPIKEIPAFLLRIGVSGILVLFGFILLLKIMITRISSEYVLTTKELYIKKGIITRSISTVDLNWIKGVEIRQSFTGRLLNYGDLEIVAPGADRKGVTRIRLIGISDPIGLKKLIEKAILKSSRIQELEKEWIELKRKFELGEIDEKTFRELKRRLEKELEI